MHRGCKCSFFAFALPCLRCSVGTKCLFLFFVCGACVSPLCRSNFHLLFTTTTTTLLFVDESTSGTRACSQEILTLHRGCKCSFLAFALPLLRCSVGTKCFFLFFVCGACVLPLCRSSFHLLFTTTTTTLLFVDESTSGTRACSQDG